MGRTGIEPYIKNVHYLIVFIRIYDPHKEAFLGPVFIPRVRALGLKRGIDAGVDLSVAQQEIGIVMGRTDLGKAGQRHTPSALARQHPVGARLDHRMQPVAPGLGRPRHQLINGRQGAFADGFTILVHAIVQRYVDRRKPLRTVQPDHRRLGAPRMRILQRDPARGQDAPNLDQLGDDSFVRTTGFAVGTDHLLACEKRQVSPERAVIKDVVGHRQFVRHADGIVIVTVAGRSVDKARTRIIRDVIPRQKRHVKIPFARRAFGTAQGVSTGDFGQFIRRYIAHTAIHIGRQTGGTQCLFGQIVSKQITRADGGRAFLGPASDLVKAIRDARPKTDRAVLWDGPWRGRPDHDLAWRAQIGTTSDHFKRHPDRL